MINEAKKADFIFIDGRFRVACALSIILNCNSNPIVAIHDFWVRIEYQVLLEFYDIEDRIDTLAVLKIKKDVDIEKVKQLYQKYQIIPN